MLFPINSKAYRLLRQFKCFNTKASQSVFTKFHSLHPERVKSRNRGHAVGLTFAPTAFVVSNFSTMVRA